jgi:hypothetical protein
MTLLRHALLLLFRPKVEWSAIASEVIAPHRLYLGYIIPLSAIRPLANTIYYIEYVHPKIGILDQMADPYWKIYWNSVLPMLISRYVWQLVAIYGVAYFLHWAAAWFAGERDARQALKVLAFALTPMWLGQISVATPFFSLDKSIPIISLCYTGYLLYLGTPIVMRVPQSKALLYSGNVAMALLGAFKAPELAQQFVLDDNLKTMIALPLVVFCLLSIVAGVLFYEKQGKLPLAKGSISACIVGITLWAAAAPSSIVAFFRNWSLADESYRIVIAIVSILCMTGLVILYEKYRKVSRTQSDD